MAEKQLSVIIVSHNALAYLDLTLRSLIEAVDHIQSEIILVDNASTEPVVSWVREHFPEVVLIASEQNLGFGKANNLGLKEAMANRILFLNPDTIVSKSNIDSTLELFDRDPKIGAIGLRMINGTGLFLPESKRSVPGLWSSFSRVLGLSSLFPKSRLFASYRMGNIPEKTSAEVEVLSGACMFLNVKEKELQQFDTDYFMYGEDIDISYRIKKAGYSVRYLGEETMVHFKGESTNKKAWWYYYWFYKTMWIFRKKHFRTFPHQIINALIFPSIWFLMLLGYLKGQIPEKRPSVQSGFKSYHIVGQKSPKLQLSLQKFQNKAREIELRKAELIIIDADYTGYNEVIELLDLKPDDQKVIFWNEEMGKFFGAY
ncbi:MAG: glycosyltransferase family 2 protein [Cytophagales bacterium]